MLLDKPYKHLYRKNNSIFNVNFIELIRDCSMNFKKLEMLKFIKH
jgi:hypothetical protein